MNFIGIYDDLLTKEECEIVISYFHKNKEAQQPGQIGYGFVDPDLKDSTDLYCFFTDSLFTHSILYKGIETAFKKYESEHPAFQYTDRFSLCDVFNLQKYEPGQGFKLWHHETTNFVNYPNPQTTRALAWMVNLNDVPDEGTMFLEQDFTMEAKTGRVSIWPAAWTHVHRGQVSEENTKYIATGWFNYDIPNPEEDIRNLQ